MNSEPWAPTIVEECFWWLPFRIVITKDDWGCTVFHISKLGHPPSFCGSESQTDGGQQLLAHSAGFGVNRIGGRSSGLSWCLYEATATRPAQHIPSLGKYTCLLCWGVFQELIGWKFFAAHSATQMRSGIFSTLIIWLQATADQDPR